MTLGAGLLADPDEDAEGLDDLGHGDAFELLRPAVVQHAEPGARAGEQRVTGCGGPDEAGAGTGPLTANAR